MKLKHLRDWVADIAAITDGGHVTLVPHESGGMDVVVNWEQAGEQVQSRHVLSGAEVDRIDEGDDPQAFADATHQITLAVREVILLEAEADDATPDA